MNISKIYPNDKYFRYSAWLHPYMHAPQHLDQCLWLLLPSIFNTFRRLLKDTRTIYIEFTMYTASLSTTNFHNCLVNIQTCRKSPLTIRLHASNFSTFTKYQSWSIYGLYNIITIFIKPKPTSNAKNIVKILNIFFIFFLLYSYNSMVIQLEQF